MQTENMTTYKLTICNAAGIGSFLYLYKDDNFEFKTYSEERFPQVENQKISNLGPTLNQFHDEKSKQEALIRIVKGLSYNFPAEKPIIRNEELKNEEPTDVDGIRFLKMYAFDLLPIEEYRKIKTNRVPKQNKKFVERMIGWIRQGMTKIPYSGEMQKEIIKEICSQYSIKFEFDKKKDMTFAFLTYK